MPWKEYHIITDKNAIDSLEADLSGLGAQAFTIKASNNEVILEPLPGVSPHWQEAYLVALFDITASDEPIDTYLQAQMASGEIKKYHHELLSDKDWERECLIDFKPLQFGKRLWICPSWLAVPDPHAVNVILDPGLAYGTGTHATTALCLEWLEKTIHDQQVVIDFGCGSGILAIAALKLGAKKVYAVDYDPQAIEATTLNAERNGCSKTDLIVCLPQDLPTIKTDLLVANILAQPLISLAPHFSELVKFSGKIFMTGILAEQEPSIIDAYAGYFHLQPAISRAEWIGMTGTRA